MRIWLARLVTWGLVSAAALAASAACPVPTQTQGVDQSDGVYTVGAEVATTPLMWIANAGEDTVSRIDTAQNRESARYTSAFWSGGVGGGGADLPKHGVWTGPAPSRSAVDFHGNAFVANRGFGRVAEVMKILASGCIDRNGNGVCETSQDFDGDGKISPLEMYPIKDENGNGIIDDKEIRDERVAWIRPVGSINEVARALAIDKQGFVWVGMFNTRRFYKIDPDTGAAVGSWSVGVNPYGAVVDGKGRLFTAALGQAWATRFDTADPDRTQTNFMVPHGYGIALGRVDGVPWVVTAHHKDLGFVRHDPDSLASSAVMPLGYSAYGISFDRHGDIVISGAYGQGTRGATKVRVDGSVVWTRNAPVGCDALSQRGAIVDAANDIWVVSMENNNVCKYYADGSYGPQVSVGSSPYTYSDATGLGLQFADPTGMVTFVTTATTLGYRWDGAPLCFDGGGEVSVRVAAADTEAGLAFANPVPLALSEQQGRLCGVVPAGVTGKLLAVTFSIKTGGSVVVQQTEGGGCTVDLPTANQPPVAVCIAAQTLVADGQCQAAAPSIDGGSADPDGAADVVKLAQAPEAGFALSLGEHKLGLTIVDRADASDSCTTVVTVVDQSPPTAACGIAAGGYAASSWPTDGALTITATGGDNCAGVTVAVSGYGATSSKGKPKGISASVDGATLALASSGGTGTIHSWTVTVTDGAGSVTTIPCSFTVGQPGGGCNNGGGNGAEGCSPSAQGHDDSDAAVGGGTETIKNPQTIAPGNGNKP